MSLIDFPEFNIIEKSALKFIYSEKATKFFEISALELILCSTVKSKVEILQIYLAFSEFMDFKILFLTCNCEYQNYRIPDLKKEKCICFHKQKDYNFVHTNKTCFITHFVCIILYLTCNYKYKDRTNRDIHRGRYYLNYYLKKARLVETIEFDDIFKICFIDTI